jgi:hypothetical protein
MSTDGTTGGSPSTGAPASTGNPASTGVPASTGAQMMGWGDDWRQRLAAGSTNSERELQQLARYESPEQIWRKARELEARMSAGEFKTALKAGASADELARWRAENGIPSEAKGYKLNLPQGKDPKEDEDFINAFLKSAHEANYTQAQVDTALKGFYAEVDRQEHALTEAEGLSVKKTEDLLRTKWGADYSVNRYLAEAFLSRALVQAEREINPAATVLPAGATNLGQTIEAELTQMRQWMAAPKGSADYQKYWGDEKMQARYRQLIDAQEGMAKKSKQAA